MAYVLVRDGIVVQKQPNKAPGFISAPDDVICGYLYDGETFAPPEPEPVGPNLAPLDPWRFWAMMRVTGNEQAVREFVAALPDPAKIVAEAQLEFSLEFRRDHPLVENVRMVLQMTETQLDSLWDQGHQLGS